MTQLIGHCTIKGTLSCVTGLRIGGSKESLEIGGTDNPIIRHPITNHPYVPGSSLKGKIRCLLEQKHRPQVMGNGKPCDCGECDVCVVFGCGRATNTRTVTRVVFRDCNLTEASLKLLDEARGSGVFYSESKSEVTIDRSKGTAVSASPRTQERIPEGTEFDFEVVLRVFSDDDVDKHVNFIKEGITLLEHDALGGSGSRGYGKVKIKNLEVTKP